MTNGVKVYFSDFFGIAPEALAEYGAINISLINDLPLFIDPFLLFNSKKPAYREQHDALLDYLGFLRDKAAAGQLSDGLIRAWMTFPEVRQTWLGFSLTGNAGRGLGMDFAKSLASNLATVFSSFGDEAVTQSSHLEKLCLLDRRVGKDKISDFTTNLIKGYLLGYTQQFARAHIDPSLRRDCSVSKTVFNYDTETWETAVFTLPWHPFIGDYVVLTPRDLLTRSDVWINSTALYDQFPAVAASVPNEQLRDQINHYFRQQLPRRPKRKDRDAAIARTLREYPQLIEWFIKLKEDTGDQARSTSSAEVATTERVMITRLGAFIEDLARDTTFYTETGGTQAETRARVAFLKDQIENKGGHRIFWAGGEPVRRESDLQIMFRLTWFATPSDVTREANDGRGPVDFKVSRGSMDKTLVEFKLASNRQLERNLLKQVEIYQKASDAQGALKVIVYFTDSELASVRRVLKRNKLDANPDVILIDARDDNKPSGSKA